MPLDLINGCDVFNSEPQVSPVLIEGILCEGASLLAGEPKVGKSTLAMQLAHAVAAGVPRFGAHAVNYAGPVLYCSLEETKDILRDRQHRISQNTADWQHMECVTDLNGVCPGADFVQAFEQALSTKRFVMAVVDPFVRVRELARQSDLFNMDYRAVGAYNEIANKRSIPILIVHHTNKKRESGDGQTRISGTNGLTAASTTNLVLVSTAPGRGKLTVSSRRMREGVHHFAMDENGLWVADQNPIAASNKSTPVLSNRARILEALGDGRELRISEIEEHMPGVPPGTIRRVLSEMKDAGEIECPTRGRYRKPQFRLFADPTSTGGDRASNSQVESDLPRAA